MVYTPTVSRFGVSHGSAGETVAIVKAANSRMKIVHGVALKGSWLRPKASATHWTNASIILPALWAIPKRGLRVGLLPKGRRE